MFILWHHIFFLPLASFLRSSSCRSSNISQTRELSISRSLIRSLKFRRVPSVSRTALGSPQRIIPLRSYFKAAHSATHLIFCTPTPQLMQLRSSYINIMKLTLLLSLLVLLTHCTILITTPVSTEFPENIVPYFYSNFGQVPYSKSLSFSLTVLNHSLCGDITELKHFLRPTYVVTEVKEEELAFCSYTRRARNAEIVGAKGLIMASPKTELANGDVLPADDGNGKKVHITTLFISMESYLRLARLDQVSIMVDFPVVKAEKSKVWYYLSGSKRASYIFLRQFQPYMAKLSSHISFEPIYHTQACPWCSAANCVTTYYCTFDYENDQVDVGTIVILQQLIQQELFKKHGVSLYLEYMSLFDEYCLGNWYFAEECSRNLLSQMNLTVSLPADSVSVLQRWRAAELGTGFIDFPEISVNNLIYHGSMDAEEVFAMICESLSKPPSSCSGKQEKRASSGMHLWAILLITCVGVLVVAVGACLYRKCIGRELTNDMTSKVNQLVARYATKVSEQNRKRKEKIAETLHEEL